MMPSRCTLYWVPLVGVLVVACPDWSLAAPGEAVPSAQTIAQKNDTPNVKRQKVVERIRALRAWKLTQALDLDEATAVKLFPILNRYDSKFADLMRESRKLRKRIRKLSNAPGANTATDNEHLLDQLVASQRKLWDLQEARFRDVRKILTAKQAATIFVVLPELDRRIHRQIRRALNGKARPGKQRGKRMERPGKQRGSKSRPGTERKTLKNPFDGLE